MQETRMWEWPAIWRHQMLEDGSRRRLLRHSLRDCQKEKGREIYAHWEAKFNQKIRAGVCVKFLAPYPDLSQVEIVPKGTLGVLKRCEHVLSGFINSEFGTMRNPGPASENPDVIAVRAAIAKATEQAN